MSELIVWVSQPLVDVTPTGSQAKATVMLTLYQSGVHVPPLHVTVRGAALAAGTTISSGTQTRSNTSG
jgi:hypothetical protein